MLSESDSWNVAPMRLAAIIAGASCGDIVTAWFRATDSIGGTSTFKATVSSSHAMSIGTANLRTNRMNFGRAWLSALWVFMRPSPSRKFGRGARPRIARP